MKKLLLSLLVMCAALAVNAQTEVVFDFDNNATALFGIEGRSTGDSHDGDITEAVTATVDGVSVTVSPKASGSNENRLWEKSPVLRMYSGSLTVAAPNHKITKIVFTGNNNFNVTVETGTLDGKIWTSSEDVAEVVFGIAKNTQIKTMTVTLNGDNSGEPEVFVPAGTGEGTVASPYDVTRAVDLINHEKNTGDNVYVKGTISVVTEVSLNFGNATYTITDGKSELIVFRGYTLGGGKFTSEGEIEDGDIVVVCGKLIDYNGKAEVAQGNYIYSINGKLYEEPSTPDDPSNPDDPTPDTPTTSWEDFTGTGLLVAQVTEDGVAAYYAMAPVVDKDKMTGVQVALNEDGKFALSENDANLLWTVDLTSLDNITIKAADGTYLTHSSKTNVKLAEEPYSWWYNETTGLISSSNENENTRGLLFKSDTKVFSAYASSNVGNKDYAVPYLTSAYVIGGTAISSTKSANGEQAIYTLSGVRVKKAERGLYIVNGKKVVVK